jgi:hypothetical protein
MSIRLTEEQAAALPKERRSFASHWGLVKRCHAASDGECDWQSCPQKREYKSYCPLAAQDDADAEVPQ